MLGPAHPLIVHQRGVAIEQFVRTAFCFAATLRNGGAILKKNRSGHSRCFPLSFLSFIFLNLYPYLKITSRASRIGGAGPEEGGIKAESRLQKAENQKNRRHSSRFTASFCLRSSPPTAYCLPLASPESPAAYRPNSTAANYSDSGADFRRKSSSHCRPANGFGRRRVA